jgi:hypothetical protein
MAIIPGYYVQRKQTSRQCAWYSLTSSWTVLDVMIDYGFANIQCQPPYLAVSILAHRRHHGLLWFAPLLHTKLIHISVVVLR